jgi:hypothetical protein
MLVNGQPGIMHGPVHAKERRWDVAEIGTLGRLMRGHPQLLPAPGVRFDLTDPLPLVGKARV